MGYIKSHSNYVLKKKHQNINDGVIYERDYTTIGGVDSFSKGQTPIYRSGNFLITINTEDTQKKFGNKGNWKENANGEVWTYDDVKDATLDSATDSQIVLKTDYYDLADYAYFGSCAEMVRNSVRDILTRFPGELYVTNDATVYDRLYGEGKKNEWVYIDNPSNIDIKTQYISDEDELHYFLINYKNYEIFINNDESNPLEIKSVKQVRRPTQIDKTKVCDIYGVEINANSLKFTIMGVEINDKTYFFTQNQQKLYNLRVRPKKEFLDKFYASLDPFESAILNPTTDPKYTADFSVLKYDAESGVRRSIDTFTFPTSYGEYNLGNVNNDFETYVANLLEIAEFYDTKFCDNMYRMMTHESIKNFDWSYSKNDGMQEERLENSEKISQLIRLFGREFDNIKFYIDGITNFNKITYDDRNNLPDYFLTDSLEGDGWDIINIYPLFMLQEDKDGNILDKPTEGYNALKISEQCNKRIFQEDFVTVIKPYKDRLSYPNGYFTTCKGDIPATAITQKYYVEQVSKDRNTVRRRVSKYTSNEEYSYKDINTLFLKRLKLNSRELARHKGTIQGVEMMLGMFGLKSNSFIGDEEADYKITEYTTFTNGVDDPYWCCKNMNRINWYNSTKTIEYNTKEYMNDNYIDYQGLPIVYRKLENGTNRLYPYFDPYDLYDGELYYQMKGGWIKNYPYTYDNDNNIISAETKMKDNTIIDSELFTETINCVKVVDNVTEIFALPINELSDNIIVYCKNIKGTYLVVDNVLLEVEIDARKKEYINVTVQDDKITIGSFEYLGDLYVSNPYVESDELYYYIPDTPNGTTIKIYLDNNHKISVTDKLETTIGDDDIKYINNELFSQDVVEETKTNYFLLNSVVFKLLLNDNFGWKQLNKTDIKYLKINKLKNYYKGNNPHTGKLNYDFGFSYMNYYGNLFNYSYDNELFDYRRYVDTYYDELDNIGQIGFKELINSGRTHTLSRSFNDKYPLYIDTKIHYFGDWFDQDKSYPPYNVETSNSWYDKNDYATQLSYTDLQNYKIEWLHGNTNELVCSGSPIDGSTYQIVNTKVINIEFKLLNKNLLSQDGMTEIKYFQDVVMPYVSQMIPSNAILSVKYIPTK